MPLQIQVEPLRTSYVPSSGSFKESGNPKDLDAAFEQLNQEKAARHASWIGAYLHKVFFEQPSLDKLVIVCRRFPGGGPFDEAYYSADVAEVKVDHSIEAPPMDDDGEPQSASVNTALAVATLWNEYPHLGDSIAESLVHLVCEDEVTLDCRRDSLRDLIDSRKEAEGADVFKRLFPDLAQGITGL